MFFIYNAILKNSFLFKKLEKLINQLGNNENQVIEISNTREKYFSDICKFIKWSNIKN